ncbi:dTDP-4-dehydrorhamnose 3,5-epimerase, partial [Campylobacter coli]|nr:dTDP-4-dehydrorhamnose 3,5-epimerase [Campylobacter coli]
AHYVSSESAVYYYKCAYLGEYVDADDQFTYAWNDERIGINWPTNSPILSDRDVLAVNKG